MEKNVTKGIITTGGIFWLPIFEIATYLNPTYYLNKNQYPPNVFPPGTGVTNNAIDLKAIFSSMSINESVLLFTTRQNHSLYMYKSDTAKAGFYVDDQSQWIIPSTSLNDNMTASEVYLCFVVNESNQVFAMLTGKNTSSTYYEFIITSYNTPALRNVVSILLTGVPLNIDDPYITDNNLTPSGGYGSFDYSSDDDLPPALPSVSAAQVGFVSLWNPSAQEMKDLADYLWTGTFDWTNFRKLFTDPMQCILSIGIVPVTPTTGVSTEIVFGGSSHSGVNAKPITSQFVLVDMGTCHIDGKSASYMDYSPYCKASIFLPYCGTYALDVDDIMDADVALEYHIDIYTGACVAYLSITRTNSDGSTLHSTLYQFTGNVLATIPVTGADHSAFLQSLLFMGAGIAATVATSGAAAPEIGGAMAAGDAVSMSPALTGIAAGSAINTVMSMKPNVLRSGNLSSTAGFLGKQKPCITMTWSNLCRPEDEQKLIGMPEYKSGTLSDFSGFTMVSAVHMENILCTDAELKMIESALYKGVIV